MGNALEASAGKADVMIIGGGPTGIGAAYRLNQYGNQSWILLDAEKQPGGLAGSIRTHEGFRFDHGYKIFSSRYEYLDRMLEECYSDSPKKIRKKSRDSYVYVRGQMVRFPLQNNLSGLPEADQLSCTLDMVRARILQKNVNKGEVEEVKIALQKQPTENSEKPETAAEKPTDSISATESEKPVDSENPVVSEKPAETENPTESSDALSEEFTKVSINDDILDDYLLRNWGESLCNILFRPYVFKSFAYPTSKLIASWAKCKIPPSDLGNDIERLLNNEQCDPELDSDSSGFYPSKGGLVSLWRNIAKKLPKENVRFRSEITELDIEEKTVKTKDGLEIKYDTLISTMPLTSLLELTGRSDLAESLIHSSLYIVCLGVRGTSPHKDITGCIYFPESDCVFHRASVFSSFDPDSVPDEEEEIPTMRLAMETDEEHDSGNSTGPYWSLMLEVSAGPLKTISDATIMNEAIRDACSVGLLRPTDEIVSIHMTEMTHGQPLPTIGSEEKIEIALKWLESRSIYSRGRFGAFKYHLGDLDHCLIQGVEAVDNILNQSPEQCLWSSPKDIGNSGKDKIQYPIYGVGVPDILEGEGINAGEVRNAITREPGSSSSSYGSTISQSSRSRSSSHQDEVSQPSDNETS